MGAYKNHPPIPILVLSYIQLHSKGSYTAAESVLFSMQIECLYIKIESCANSVHIDIDNSHHSNLGEMSYCRAC